MDSKKKILLMLAVQSYMRKKNAVRRKRNILLVILLNVFKRRRGVSLSLNEISQQRRYWMFLYEQNWFDRMLENEDNSIFQELWRHEFRMSPETFNYIVAQVRQEMSRKNTKFRRSIRIEKRVAIALWRLSTGSSYRNISKVFGVGRSTASEISNEFCQVLKEKAARFIKFPRGSVQVANEIQKFKATTDCRIPQIVGAIDGTHVEITSPGGYSRVDYYCRKQMYSINTQAIVGGNSMFIDVVTGFPGSVHDARILRYSSVYAMAEQGHVLATPTQVVEGFRVRPLLLGDGAYPSLTWLAKPFPHHLNLTQNQKCYNKALSSARVSVEQAFGLLKARWRCLLKRLDCNMENVSNVIIACCVLHNICQQRHEFYIDDDDVLENVLRTERRGRRSRPLCNQVCRDGDILRDVLMDYIVNNV